MSITIVFGWWIIPAVITVYAILRAFKYSIKRGPVKGPYDSGLDLLLVYSAAIISSLLPWLIYTILLLIFRWHVVIFSDRMHLPIHDSCHVSVFF
jgi:hypothetical protein